MMLLAALLPRGAMEDGDGRKTTERCGVESSDLGVPGLGSDAGEFARLRGLNVGTLRQGLYSRSSDPSAAGAQGQFVELRVSVAAPAEGARYRVRLGAVEMQLAALPSAVWLRSLAGLEAVC